ncbi:hypothetical protein EsDP_00007418 [Epichloe bromicola]|uniref:HNH nuclease domain-containing protein n=1 Tax=Epichloe bromicola TaxID=79588 RepID=A0ABQ0D0I0_9HYPO
MDESYAEYCQQYSNNPMALDALKRFLDDRPVYQPTVELLPVNEYELRLDIITRIEKQARSVEPNFQVNAAIFSLFMIMPLQQLKDLDTPGLGYVHGMVVESLGYIPQIIRSFTRGPTKATQNTSSETAKPKKRGNEYELDLATGTGHKRFRSEGSGLIGSGSGSGSQVNVSSPNVNRNVSSPSTNVSSPEPNRNKSELMKCQQRDGHRCIITKTDCPEVCHVIPFSWSGSGKNYAEVMSKLFYGKTDRYLLGGDGINVEMRVDLMSGNSDKSWNMICLSPSLHTWWDKAYFGLKYLGSMPSESDNAQSKVIVTLEFRWLMQNQHSLATDTLNQQQQRDFRAKLFKTPQPAVAANVCPSNRPILSGQTFDVTLDDIDAPKFITVIKLQWALVQLAAMSGGAEPTDESRRDQMAQLLAQQEEPVSVAEWTSQVPAG